MASLSVYKCDIDGGAPTFTAATAAGDSFANSGRVILIVKNGGTAETTVTVDAVRLCNYGYDHNATMTVAAGGEGWMGVFPVFWYNDEEDLAHITYTATADVTVAVVEV